MSVRQRCFQPLRPGLVTSFRKQLTFRQALPPLKMFEQVLETHPYLAAAHHKSVSHLWLHQQKKKSSDLLPQVFC